MGCYCSVWSNERIEPWISCCSSHKPSWGPPRSHFPVCGWTQHLEIQSFVHFLSKITPLPAHPSATLVPNLLIYRHLDKYTLKVLQLTSAQTCRCLWWVQLASLKPRTGKKNKAPTDPKLFKPNNNSAVRDYRFEFTLCLRRSLECPGCTWFNNCKARVGGSLLFKIVHTCNPARLAARVNTACAHKDRHWLTGFCIRRKWKQSLVYKDIINLVCKRLWRQIKKCHQLRHKAPFIEVNL